jgi:hypothetical protein
MTAKLRGILWLALWLPACASPKEEPAVPAADPVHARAPEGAGPPRPGDLPESETPSPDTPFVANMPPGNWDESMDPDHPRVADPTAILMAPWVTSSGSSGGGRRARRQRRGADETNQFRVEAGLDWLARHQVPDAGYWDCDGFQAQCRMNVCAGTGQAANDPGVTGLALLAFLGAGYTHREGHYRTTVENAIRYLRRIQDAEGCFGGRNDPRFVYGHAICTLALAEAYAQTEDALLRPYVGCGLDFIYACQNPRPDWSGFLGWGYGVRSGRSDTSVTGWMTMALKSAAEGKFPVNRPAIEGVRTFLESVTEPVTGKVGYRERAVGPMRNLGRETVWPPVKSEATTAVGVFCRIFANAMLGIDSSKEVVLIQGAQVMASTLPVWNEGDGSIDHYYWYFGTLAMFQVGGGYWKKWNAALKPAIIEHQRTSGDEAGSWDPVDPWGLEGGRVYSTALMTMCLEVYYRYGKVFPPKEHLRRPR